MKTPRLFIVEDDTTVQYGYKQYFAKIKYETTFADTLKKAKDIIGAEHYDAILLDMKLPDGDSIDWIPELKVSHPHTPIIIITGINDIAVAVKAIKLGAENFLTKPVLLENLKEILENCISHEAIEKTDINPQRQKYTSGPYFGENKATAQILQQAHIAASGDAVVLLTGETGTGKGVIARWIHENSKRKDKAFVEVNCSGLKGDLLSSELFGHTRGAFTSAVADKQGLIEVADGGTLFFDEIGDMSMEVQAQLLKTIEEKSFRRIGETSLRKSNFRLICATNRDLKNEIKNFRRDLYYRISTYPMHLPPLRQRKDELVGLTEYFLTNFGYTLFPLDSEVIRIISTYPWPGNSRELKNVLERALMISQGKNISPIHFPDLSAELIQKESQKLENVEDAHILEVLEMFNGDKRKTCLALGISLSSLYRRLSKCLTTSDTEQLYTVN
jgi:DNA-binding NtrC family response regulator